MELLHKHFTFAVKADEARVIEGYGATFGNVDSYNDIILPNAFAESLASGRKVKMLSQHNSNDVAGVWDELREDANGLYVKGRFAKTACGNDLYELALMGAIDSMSIGYTVVDSEYSKEGIRLLKKLELWEVSIVTFPANDKAKITQVKNAPDNEREFEKFLRDAGYSRDAAKVITARGFKALSGQREVEAEDAQRAAELAAFLTSIKL